MTQLDPAFAASTQGAKPAPLDPQVQLFVQKMAADASKFPRRDTVSIDEGREIAEQVRAPWTEGGPQMARTVEHQVPTRHGEVMVRVYYPSERRMPGAFFYIHGGGFVLFSVNTHDRVMREYAQRAGIVVVGINYTRAPEAKFPQPIEECIDTVNWLKANAGALEFDAAQLFIGGDSAGGNLSLGTCLHFRDIGESPIRGMVLNYTGFSTDLYQDSVVRYGAGDFGLSLHMMVWFYRNYLGRKEDYTDPRMNLLDADLRGIPPAYLVITECDPLYDGNIDMVAKMKKEGVDVESKIYKGTVHSFLEAVSVAEVAGVAFDDTVSWLQRHA
ncbi:MULTISPECIES: alpha/beta hydrolase fold domain-containing protein [unclassified Variovorax]|jgi:acetyl esterase|uniref:alpha/beta hydrolase fold domain-containing protein n=1 Tax=unclassified Variovorax TaxID=663243 RepID=UPI0008C8F676|nr:MULTISPECIES: alpha/beta hydrolase fold domain-containing protein [unclassified Variovorax]SEK09024.1 acetyl esterase [Variovorax sp. OK202]SFD60174.1 acetyl esterase [Variovorax sp. OK212]